MPFDLQCTNLGDPTLTRQGLEIKCDKTDPVPELANRTKSIFGRPVVVCRAGGLEGQKKCPDCKLVEVFTPRILFY